MNLKCLFGNGNILLLQQTEARCRAQCFAYIFLFTPNRKSQAHVSFFLLASTFLLLLLERDRDREKQTSLTYVSLC